VKTGCDLAEHYKEGCGSKRAVLPTMMMMMMMIGNLIKNYSGPDLSGSDRDYRPEASMRQKWVPQTLL
jgi:hypothetical protein